MKSIAVVLVAVFLISYAWLIAAIQPPTEVIKEKPVPVLTYAHDVINPKDVKGEKTVMVTPKAFVRLSDYQKLKEPYYEKTLGWNCVRLIIEHQMRKEGVL